MNKDWFVDWFNTSYYHTLYQHRDEGEACRFIDNLCVHLKIKEKAKIIDLACGKGRHAMHLAKKGFQTTGVDLAAESIRIAQVNALNNRVENAHFDIHDIRETYIEKGFDYVFNLFTSFGYFEKTEENLKVLAAASGNLNRQGVFVLDYLNVQKTIPNLIPQESKNLDGIQFDIQRQYNGKHIIKDIVVHDQSETHHFQERVAAFDRKTLEKMVSKVNLKIVDVFGDYDLNQFDTDKSDRLILVMRIKN
ncbi:MAG: class I SAM-dependent methyltransferase [Flavobacteriales bacterium]|nr:class I SAM-dependent methyltransferase [Flavobacteriales bacterium]